MGLGRAIRQGAAVIGIAGIALGAATWSATAGTPRDSVSLPRHIRVGKPAAITLTGYAPTASRTDVQLNLLSDRRRCLSSDQAEGNLSDVSLWTIGEFVHGHFRLVKRVPYPVSTHGPMYFCAYLVRGNPDGSETTLSRSSLRFSIPS